MLSSRSVKPNTLASYLGEGSSRLLQPDWRPSTRVEVSPASSSSTPSSALPHATAPAGPTVPSRRRLLLASAATRRQHSPPVSSASSSDAKCAPVPSVHLHRRWLLLAAASAGGGAAQLARAQAAAAAAVAEGPRTDQPVDVEGRVFLLTASDQEALNLSERQILQLNQRVQAQNRAPDDFPAFIREGFDVKVIAPGFKMSPDGIIYKDYQEGKGKTPEDGQEVVFNYTGFNESATPIDSSYRQGRPAQTQIGTKGLIPGFELALRSMKVGTQRRFIVPPALGPPVGPSTFFSAKQCEVFDVELLDIRTCRREQSLMFSKVVCE